MHRRVVLLGAVALCAMGGGVSHLRSVPTGLQGMRPGGLRELPGGRAPGLNQTAAAWGEVYRGYRRAINLLDAADPDALLMARCARRAARIQAEALGWMLAPPSRPPAPAVDREA